ncbi:MAG: flagellar biosynthesis anti-sigma factor FlgM [Spirochaetes bacterium]|nr:flagellar biosynthesis anti-sigma factor FlgM [Spirochaetota bacterium]
MVIDKLGNIKNIVETKKTKSAPKSEITSAPSDKLEISSEGLKAAEEAKYIQMVKDSPDVRLEKVLALKEQIANGTYDRHLDNKVLNAVAGKLLNGIFSE